MDDQTPINTVSKIEPTTINPISQENISTNNHLGGDESSMNTADVIAEVKCLEPSNRRYDAIFIERITNKPFNDLRSYRSNQNKDNIIYTGIAFEYNGRQ